MKAEVMVTLGSATISKAKEEENHAQAKACRNEPIQKKQDQARKSTGRMPWHQEPTKDVVSCEKPWGAANERRAMDIRMGEPGGGKAPST